MKEVSIDQAGWLVLPKQVREALAIKPGDTLTVSLHGSTVTLTPNKAISRFVRKGKALVFSAVGDEQLTNKEVERLMREAQEERERIGNFFPGKRCRRA